jgi:hypothetical protein
LWTHMPVTFSAYLYFLKNTTPPNAFAKIVKPQLK